MVIKEKDNIEPAVEALETLLAIRSISKKQRELLEEEIDMLRAGARGEKEAAYHINFKFKDSKNHAIIHDLRLEENGRVAQIDHLIIGRCFDIFVVESKNFTTEIRMNPEGEFEVKGKWGWKGMQSPVEQNKRHVRVLGDLIEAHALTPVRLGLRIKPEYHNWVLVSPGCRVSKKSSGTTILKMDMFDKHMEDWYRKDAEFSLKGVVSMAKSVFPETLMEFAKKLVSHHRPIQFDYAAKFGINVERLSSPGEPIPALQQKARLCESCGASLDYQVVRYCQLNKTRFGGKLLCRKCQQTPKAGKCESCNVPVDEKVVAFCRDNGRRFNKKILCRKCQAKPRPVEPPPLPVIARTPHPDKIAKTVYLYLNDAVTGPFDSSQLPALLSAGSIQMDTPCSIAGAADWNTVKDYV